LGKKGEKIKIGSRRVCFKRIRAGEVFQNLAFLFLRLPLPSLREATSRSDDATPSGWSNSPEKLIVPPHFWIASLNAREDGKLDCVVVPLTAPLLAKTTDFGEAKIRPFPSSRAIGGAVGLRPSSSREKQFNLIQKDIHKSIFVYLVFLLSY